MWQTRRMQPVTAASNIAPFLSRARTLCHPAGPQSLGCRLHQIRIAYFSQLHMQRLISLGLSSTLLHGLFPVQTRSYALFSALV